MSLNAHAATNIGGGVIANQTWTVSGSPYIIAGDIIIPAASTLTIEPGVQVLFASTDAMGGGDDANRVELVVHGTLAVTGDASAPVVFSPEFSTSPGAWYGIVVADSTSVAVSIQHAEIHYARFGITHKAPITNTLVQDTVITHSQTAGFYVSAGTPP